MERADELGEAPGGDRPVPLGAEDLAVDSLLVLPLRFPQLLPDPAPEMIGKGRGFGQQLACEQASRSGRPESFRPGPAQAASLLDDPFWRQLAKPKAAAKDAHGLRHVAQTSFAPPCEKVGLPQDRTELRLCGNSLRTGASPLSAAPQGFFPGLRHDREVQRPLVEEKYEAGRRGSGGRLRDG